MPASIFAVVYSNASKACRRVIVADTDAEVNAVQNRLAPGESVAFLNHTDHPTDKRIRACMADLAARIAPAGQSVLQMRSVHVQGGTVVGASMCDPSVDSLPNRTLVAHDQADVGDRWNGSVFYRPFIFVDHQGNAKTLNALTVPLVEHGLLPPVGPRV